MSFANTHYTCGFVGRFIRLVGCCHSPLSSLAKDQLTELEVNEEHDAEADAGGTVAPH